MEEKTPRSFYSVASENDNTDHADSLYETPNSVEGLLDSPLYAGKTSLSLLSSYL